MTSNDDSVIETLKRIMVDDLDLDLAYEDIDEDVPLFEGGLALDSVVVVELISFIEKRFNITLPEEMLTLDAFKNLRSMAQAVGEQLVVQERA